MEINEAIAIARRLAQTAREAQAAYIECGYMESARPYRERAEALETICDKLEEFLKHHAENVAHHSK